MAPGCSHTGLGLRELVILPRKLEPEAVSKWIDWYVHGVGREIMTLYEVVGSYVDIGKIILQVVVRAKVLQESVVQHSVIGL